jgi:putative two-component system hydrogenase maturation factor HypX/HoxX
MTQAERAIDWAQDTTDNIIAKLRAADSAPGVREEIAGHSVYLFGVAREPELRGKAGSFIAHSNGAICRATSDGALWVRQAKHQGGIKLPAAQILLPLLKRAQKKVPRELRKIPVAVEDIRCDLVGHVAYLHFDFPGGAMSTGQCQRLLDRYDQLQASDARVIVLMGGEDFWSNGIHLNCIEAAQDPAQESWENINAMDDLIEAIIRTPNQITLAAMRNNAGAGGAIMALACDHVILREGVVLNPHYQSMGLYGSEYWTYLLPRRVGRRQAQTLAENCLPLLATEALQIGFADEIFDENWAVFQRELEQYCQLLSQSADFGLQLEAKRAMRATDEKNKPLQLYRDEELEKMSAAFFDPKADYHRARRDFVYKLPASKTPARLQKNIRFWQRGVFS